MRCVRQVCRVSFRLITVNGKDVRRSCRGSGFRILLLRTQWYQATRVFIPLALLADFGLTKMSIDMLRDPNISASAILAMISAMQLTLVGMLGEAIASRLGRFNPQTAYGVRPKEMLSVEEEAANSEQPIARRTSAKSVVYSLAKH